jgi:hypothetical protein
MLQERKSLHPGQETPRRVQASSRQITPNIAELKPFGRASTRSLGCRLDLLVANSMRIDYSNPSMASRYVQRLEYIKTTLLLRPAATRD